MKAVWTGSISFGLVNIPVYLYTAIKPHSPGFTLLHDKCHTPIVYERRCPHCDEIVSWAHTVKGLKQSDGSYFILTQENLKKLKPEKSNYLNMQQFVPASELQPIYIDGHYYIAPVKNHEKEFYLFHQALVKSGLVAIGSFVMHEKEHVCAILPFQDGLLLNTLNYSYEINDIAQVLPEKQKPKMSAQELKLADQLIKQLTRKKFDLTQFKDTFKEKLTAALKAQKKMKGKKPAKKVTAKKPAKQKETSLTTALRASLHKKPRSTSRPVAYARGKK